MWPGALNNLFHRGPHADDPASPPRRQPPAAGPVKALSDRTDLLNRGGGQSQGGGGASCSDLVVDEKLPTHLRGARFFTRFEVEEAHAALRRGDLGSADGGALPVGMNDQISRLLADVLVRTRANITRTKTPHSKMWAVLRPKLHLEVLPDDFFAEELPVDLTINQSAQPAERRQRRRGSGAEASASSEGEGALPAEWLGVVSWCQAKGLGAAAALAILQQHAGTSANEPTPLGARTTSSFLSDVSRLGEPGSSLGSFGFPVPQKRPGSPLWQRNASRMRSYESGAFGIDLANNSDFIQRLAAEGAGGARDEEDEDEAAAAEEVAKAAESGEEAAESGEEAVEGGTKTPPPMEVDIALMFHASPAAPGGDVNPMPPVPGPHGEADEADEEDEEDEIAEEGEEEEEGLHLRRATRIACSDAKSDLSDALEVFKSAFREPETYKQLMKQSSFRLEVYNANGPSTFGSFPQLTMRYSPECARLALMHEGKDCVGACIYYLTVNESPKRANVLLFAILDSQRYNEESETSRGLGNLLYYHVVRQAASEGAKGLIVLSNQKSQPFWSKPRFGLKKPEDAGLKRLKCASPWATGITPLVCDFDQYADIERLLSEARQAVKPRREGAA